MTSKNLLPAATNVQYGGGVRSYSGVVLNCNGTAMLGHVYIKARLLLLCCCCCCCFVYCSTVDALIFLFEKKKKKEEDLFNVVLLLPLICILFILR